MQLKEIFENFHPLRENTDLRALFGSFVKPSALRTLSNPENRVPVPSDFPRALSASGSFGTEIVAVIKSQLEARGIDPESVRRINVAYPQKHPESSHGRHNSAISNVDHVIGKVKEAWPEVTWTRARAIYEKRHLDRSGDQTSLHALTGRQIYDVDPALLKTPFPFIDAANKETEYFILVDDCIEQGTTLANLMGYIHHNGGVVLAAVASSQYLAQRHSERKHKLDDPELNKGRIPDLAHAFAASAAAEGCLPSDWQPIDCIRMLESRLAVFGNSVHALTNGECDRLIATVTGAYYVPCSFPEMIKDLDQKIAAEMPARTQEIFFADMLAKTMK